MGAPRRTTSAYLWKEILTPEGLTDILENYAEIVEERDRRTGKKKRKRIFPRYHQLDVVRQLLADARAVGAVIFSPRFCRTRTRHGRSYPSCSTCSSRSSPRRRSVMLGLLQDDTEVYKQFVQNSSFKQWVTELVFRLTSDAPGGR